MTTEEQNELDRQLEEIRVRDEARDTTILTVGVLGMFILFIAFLFVGDLFFDKKYLTAELIHSIGGWIGGYVSAIVTAKIGKKAAEVIQGSRGRKT